MGNEETVEAFERGQRRKRIMDCKENEPKKNEGIVDQIKHEFSFATRDVLWYYIKDTVHWRCVKDEGK